MKRISKASTHKRSSSIDDYYDLIKELLSDNNQQVFYYKRVLWQFLKDHHNLCCAASSFRRYNAKRPEFQEYFNKGKKYKNSSRQVSMRFETPAGKQAQLDWKESQKFLLKSGEWIEVHICVVLLSYS